MATSEVLSNAKKPQYCGANSSLCLLADVWLQLPADAHRAKKVCVQHSCKEQQFLAAKTFNT